MRILIAEDEAVTRRLLEGYLTKWGYEVISAANGNEAWDHLKAPDPPRLVVLDWMMPGMDGIELCRRIRHLETGSLMYIILFTSGQKRRYRHGF